MCDQPHPLTVKKIIRFCREGKMAEANSLMNEKLWEKGYSPLDILGTLFKVAKSSDEPEFLKLEFLKVPFVYFGVNLVVIVI